MKGLTDPMDYFLIDTPKLLLKKTNISWTTPSVVFNSFTQLHWKIFTRDPTIILFFQRGWSDSPDQRGVGSNPEDKNLPGLSLRSWDFNSYFRIYFHLFLSDPSPIIGNACHSLTDWLTHCRSVNLIDVTLACEDGNSNLLMLLLLLVLMIGIVLATVCCKFGSWGLVIKLNFCSDFVHNI